MIYCRDCKHRKRHIFTHYASEGTNWEMRRMFPTAVPIAYFCNVDGGTVDGNERNTPDDRWIKAEDCPDYQPKPLVRIREWLRRLQNEQTN